MNQSKLSNFLVSYNNNEEFHELKGEIFTRDTYYFELPENIETFQPVIIDAGAHIGLATLYFKKLFPAARVIAIEPHPENFQILEENIWQNRLEDVELHNVALSNYKGSIELHADTEFDWFSSASVHQGAWSNDQKTQPITVLCQPLADFLTQPIDFLKMDIEGAEQKVLLAADDKLRQVQHMMIEFHPVKDQDRFQLTDFLESKNFKVKTWKKNRPIKLSQAWGLIMIEAIRR